MLGAASLTEWQVPCTAGMGAQQCTVCHVFCVHAGLWCAAVTCASRPTCLVTDAQSPSVHPLKRQCKSACPSTLPQADHELPVHTPRAPPAPSQETLRHLQISSMTSCWCRNPTSFLVGCMLTSTCLGGSLRSRNTQGLLALGFWAVYTASIARRSCPCSTGRPLMNRIRTERRPM